MVSSVSDRSVETSAKRPGIAAGGGRSTFPMRLVRGLAVGSTMLLLPGLAIAQPNEPPIKPGFPLVISESPANQVSPLGQLVVAHLELTTTFKSIIYGLPNGDLYVIRRTGTN